MPYKTNRCIWYISKYVSPPAKNSSGGRGYLLMRELARMGFTSVILTSDSNRLADVPSLADPVWIQQSDGMTVCWIRSLKYTVAKSLRRVLSWLDFEFRLWRMPKAALPRPDAIIVSSLSLLTILNGFYLRWKYRCRLVLEVRDIWPLTIVEEGGFKHWNPLVMILGIIERMGYRYADSVVGTMPNLGEHVQRILGRRRTTYCIPMGVDDATLNNAERLDADYTITFFPNDKFIVAYAGAIGISNALDTFLCCAETMQGFSGVYFLVVGDGDLREQYRIKYKHLSNLAFAPRVSKQKVQDFLSRCDLLYFSVHASRVWQYGQSLNKVIDYMLAGKPIVASYTGYPSMINEAACGSYVPAGDAQALRDEIAKYVSMSVEDRKQIGNRGREWIIKHRRYDVLARKYSAILFPGVIRPS